MYIGPFFFDTKEIILLCGVIILVVLMWLDIPLKWFDRTTLLTISLIFLITKGLLPALHNEAFFILALTTIVLSLYFPLFPLVLFFTASLILFRILKVV